MKHLIYIFALAGIALAACSKENSVTEMEEQASQSGTYTYVLNGSVADELTKTTYTNDQTFSWSNGDQISVLFHKGDENKFFTFTIEKGGSASGKFVGEVTDGYTIGSSDDGTKWALYPANANHIYDKDASDKVSFFIPTDSDISATPSAINIPMEARGDADDNFTFKQTTCAYKFVFKGLTAVSKVKLTVENTGNGYYMSGNSPLRFSTPDYYLEMYNSPLGGSKIVSITTSVVSNTATIYVPSRGWNSLQANITLQNMDAGANYENIIYKASSTGTGLSSTTWGRICKLPSLDVSSYGVGVPFWSAFGVNWASVDMLPLDDEKDAFPGDGTRILDWKATADATNIHLYFKTSAAVAQDRGLWNAYIVTGFDTDNDSDTGENGSYGLGSGFEARSITFPFSNAAGSPVTFYLPNSPNTSSDIKCPISGASAGNVATNGGLKGDYAYVEIRIPRSQIGSPAAGSIRVRNAYGSTSSAAQIITLP